MATKTIDISESQTNLTEMLSLVRTGTEIILTEGNKAIARLIPIESDRPRVLGLHSGSVWMSDDFDEPLPEEFWTGP